MVRSQLPRATGQQRYCGAAARRRKESAGHQGVRRGRRALRSATMRFRTAAVVAASVALALTTAYARVPQGRGAGAPPVVGASQGQTASPPGQPQGSPTPLVATGIIT